VFIRFASFNGFGVMGQPPAASTARGRLVL
jgi:hypothetical protein